MYMTDSEFINKYPEQKPICFNYADARNDVLSLCEESTRLRKRLAAFEEGINPDAAAKFDVVADDVLAKMDAIIDGISEKAGIKTVSVNEVSQFLQDAGFEGAAQALRCKYNL